MAIHTVVLHHKPHLDELFALWMLRTLPEGEEMFPDIIEAEVRYVDAGLVPEEGADALEDRGELWIGVGGGRFDEHPNGVNGDRRVHGECAATLIAEALGVRENSVIGPLLEYVLKNDTKGGGKFDIAYFVKLLSQEDAEHFAFTAFNAEYAKQREFFSAGEDFERAEVERITLASGKELRLVFGESGNEQFARYARSTLGVRASLVVQKKLDGSYFLSMHPRAPINLSEVVRCLRMEEQKQAGRVRVTDWDLLEEEGTLPEIPEWSFHPSGGWIFNGSLRTEEVPPTRIPWETLKRLVISVIDPEAFPEKHKQQCLRGRCTASRQNPCPWQPFGLRRCRRIRYEQHTAS